MHTDGLFRKTRLECSQLEHLQEIAIRDAPSGHMKILGQSREDDARSSILAFVVNLLSFESLMMKVKVICNLI